MRGMVHTNSIESFRSMLKRGCQGSGRKMPADHLGRYVDEYSRRHNVRIADTLEQIELTMRRMVGKRLRYRDRVWSNGLRSGARAVAA